MIAYMISYIILINYDAPFHPLSMFVSHFVGGSPLLPPSLAQPPVVRFEAPGPEVATQTAKFPVSLA